MPRCTDTRRLLAAGWLTIGVGPDSSVLVTVVGDIAAPRADELWSTVEQVMEHAAGGPVIVDLRRVTSFDSRSITALTALGRGSARRRLELCALIRADSALEYRARSAGLPAVLPTHVCVSGDGR